MVHSIDRALFLTEHDNSIRSYVTKMDKLLFFCLFFYTILIILINSWIGVLETFLCMFAFILYLLMGSKENK